jgi:hypothetical protein
MKAAYQLLSLLKDDKEWKEALLQFIKARTRLIEAETLLKLQRIRVPRKSPVL